VTNVLPSLSNVVTALANGRLLRVDSSGEAGGLLQKPGLAPGKEKAHNFAPRRADLTADLQSQSLKAHNFAPRRAGTDLTADLGSQS
jgi:hypothetical protein